MKIKGLTILFIFILFVSGCACMGGGYCSSGYYPTPCNYCNDCYNKRYYYSHCDYEWHNSFCEDKPYSYVKTKRIDFPIDYRTKYAECCMTVTPYSYCTK